MADWHLARRRLQPMRKILPAVRRRQLESRLLEGHESERSCDSGVRCILSLDTRIPLGHDSIKKSDEKANLCFCGREIGSGATQMGISRGYVDRGDPLNTPTIRRSARGNARPRRRLAGLVQHLSYAGTRAQSSSWKQPGSRRHGWRLELRVYRTEILEASGNTVGKILRSAASRRGFAIIWPAAAHTYGFS